MEKTTGVKIFATAIIFFILSTSPAWADTVATPVFTPDGGTYNTEQNVVITCATPGAVIHYTTTGLNPIESDPIIVSGGTLTVSVDPSTTLKARAWKTGFTASAVKFAVYSDTNLKYSGGSGTSEDPYIIAYKENLLELAATASDYDKCFLLILDIDMEGQVFTTAIIAPDTSTINGFQGTAFTGVFDGNGHKITNFNIDSWNHDHLGLFGCTGSGSEIKNLGLESFSVNGYSYVGGLAGENSYGSIRNCNSTGAASGNGAIGGLIGYNSHGNINFCYSTGTVCGDYAGGLVGWNVFGNISNCYSTSNIVVGYESGGLVGCNESGSISNCYSTGNVYGVWEGIGNGGLAGINQYDGVISNCYSTGFVSIEGMYYAGGLIGGNYNAVVQNSFWDKQTSGLTSSAGGIGKTTAEMKTLSTFTTDPNNNNWDFTNETANGTNDYWRMCVNGVDYPRLNWESIEGDFACPDGVNIEDLDSFVERWLLDNCASENNYCGGVDIDISGKVDLEDWAIFAQSWLDGV